MSVVLTEAERSSILRAMSRQDREIEMLRQVVAAARPCAEVLCDERDLDRLREAIREYDQWQERRKEDSQP